MGLSKGTYISYARGWLFGSVMNALYAIEVVTLC